MGRKYLKSTECITFEVKERVATITLNRPEKRNALSGQLVQELYDGLLEADALNAVNVIVLQGAGKDFCAGYDLMGTYGGNAEDGDDAFDPDDYRTMNGTMDDDIWNMEETQRRTLVPFDIHKPIIAKVHGNCLAGGTDLAFMCDIVIAADNARIGFPATRANGTPPNNMWFYHCGPQWAKRMLFTGDHLSGRDAARIGLVMDSVPAEELDAEVAELARRISFVDTGLLATQKRIVNVAMELAGAKTLQRMAIEQDAIAHTTRGPRRSQFREDVMSKGLREALKNRDEPFGDSKVRVRWPEERN